MVCAEVFGNDVAISLGCSNGNFQLNVYKPLIAHNILRSIRLLADAMHSFRRFCIDGLQLNVQRIETNLEQSLMLVTALTPKIGYDKAAAIAKEAHESGSTLKEAAVKLQLLSADEFDRWVQPREMIHP